MSITNREAGGSGRPPPDAGADGGPGSVYWMDASKRRRAMEWLRREDLTPDERADLRTFVERWRTDPALPAAERRRLSKVFERVERRLSHRPHGSAPP